jgi:hypothetical protein
MLKPPLNALFLALLAVVASACGDPGNGSFDDEQQLEDELGFGEESGLGDEVALDDEVDDESLAFEADAPADDEPVNALIAVPPPVFDQVEELVLNEGGLPPFNEAKPSSFDEVATSVEELSEEELALIAGVDRREELVERIVAGEVLVEDLGNGVVVAEGLSESEIAELEANGFEVQVGS